MVGRAFDFRAGTTLASSDNGVPDHHTIARGGGEFGGGPAVLFQEMVAGRLNWRNFVARQPFDELVQTRFREIAGQGLRQNRGPRPITDIAPHDVADRPALFILRKCGSPGFAFRMAEWPGTLSTGDGSGGAGASAIAQLRTPLFVDDLREDHRVAGVATNQPVGFAHHAMQPLGSRSLHPAGRALLFTGQEIDRRADT